MPKTVEEYLSQGYDLQVAEYFASGIKKIVSIKPTDDFALEILYDNNEIRLYDCKPLLRVGTVFEPFMQIENFKRVYLDDCGCPAWDIDPNVDSNVVWMNKLDLCPDACYIKSVPIKADI